MKKRSLIALTQMSEERINKLSTELNISPEDVKEIFHYEAEETVKPDQKPMKAVENTVLWVAGTTTSGKTQITEESLVELEELLRALKGTEAFQNKDLSIISESLGLTPRQMPSRLKRLVANGVLEDLGGSPKHYKLKG